MFRWLLAGALALVVAGTALVIPGLDVAHVEPGELDAKGGDTLVVMVHGFALEPDDLKELRNTLRAQDEYFDADVLTPRMPFSLFSLARPGRVVADLLLAIDAAWQERVAARRPYRRIVLVGHNMGGLYARKVYAAATGQNAEAPFETDLLMRIRSTGSNLNEVRPWAAAVERIVLLAGLNRGWTLSHHMSLTRSVQMWLGTTISSALELVHGHAPIVFSMRKGSPFITQLRLQWLAMRRHAGKKGVGGALTVQLLGTVDDLVAPDDNVDLVSGGDFVYLEVPHSGHRNVIEHADPTHGAERAAVFVQALTLRDLSGVAVTPPGERVIQEPDVTDVVFVIHGNRDEGFWTQKMARRIVARGAAAGRRISAETSSYGYFPMLSFLWPGARRDKVEWLMDRYTEALARYPNARFSYVGHGHGTYLLARALEDYPAVRFRNVVFAGSVVRTGFPWTSYVDVGRIERVVNFVASADWVVAFFPKAMQTVGFQDLGGAGHDGFDEAPVTPAVQEARFVEGGHEAALKEDLWAAIADFVVDGRFEPPPDAAIADDQSLLIAIPAEIAPLVWLAIAAVVLALLWLLLRAPFREWQKTLAVLAYFYALWLVLTRV
jgi:hypothetical protein